MGVPSTFKYPGKVLLPSTWGSEASLDSGGNLGGSRLTVSLSRSGGVHSLGSLVEKTNQPESISVQHQQRSGRFCELQTLGHRWIFPGTGVKRGEVAFLLVGLGEGLK